MFDWEGLKFQGFIYDNAKGRQIALAVLMENIKIDKIIEKFMKKPFDKIAWMSRARACKFIGNRLYVVEPFVMFIYHVLENLLSLVAVNDDKMLLDWHFVFE